MRKTGRAGIEAKSALTLDIDMDDLKKLSAAVGLPPSLELRTVDGIGRGVFTKESISAGDTIFSALPIAHCSVEETRGTVCEHCFNTSK